MIIMSIALDTTTNFRLFSRLKIFVDKYAAKVEKSYLNTYKIS